MPTPTSSENSGSSLFQGASPKLTFIFGLVVGVALASIIGMILVLTGSFEGKKSATAGTTTNTATTGTDTQEFGDVAKVSDDDNIRGDKNATLSLIEYSDLECPFCQRFHPVMKQVLEEYDGKVNWVYRHFPLSFHANAQKESEAALCVDDLGGNDKFWSFIDKIYERTTATGTGFALDKLGPLAAEVGVNEAKFKECLDSGKMASKVTEQMNDGQANGASGTPTTFVVGKDGKTITGIPGAYSYEQVKQIVDQALSS